MSNVLFMPNGKLDAKALLEGIKDNNFQELVVIGIDESGHFYLGALTDDTAEINLMIDVAKGYLIERLRKNISGAEPE